MLRRFTFWVSTLPIDVLVFVRIGEHIVECVKS